jgi:tetratricopeptide (TPR) repeat protein
MPFDRHVDAINHRKSVRHIYINNVLPSFSEEETHEYFAYIDSLSSQIARSRVTSETMDLLLLRAVAFASLQNFESAIDDFSTYLQEDSICVPALWMRAVCQARINQFMSATGNNSDNSASLGSNAELKNANVLADLNHALALDPQNAYIYYNRATLYAQRQDYGRAIEDYTRAITIDANMAEAYFNRGLCAVYRKQLEAGLSDLSKAGELGLYSAYSIIKKYRK